MTPKSRKRLGFSRGFGWALALGLLLSLGLVDSGAQPATQSDQGSPLSQQGSAANSNPDSAAIRAQLAAGFTNLTQWSGLPVKRISFEGVAAQRLTSLQGRLPQAEGAPLDADKVAESLRALYLTGLFDSAEVTGEREGDGVALIFRGAPRTFIAKVTVAGAKGGSTNLQLGRASRLNTGERLSEDKLNRALDQMKLSLEGDGFYQSKITYTLNPYPTEQLADIAFLVAQGPKARIGKIQVTGDSGLTLEEFRARTHMRAGANVDHDTVNRALAGLLKYYREQKRLEAEIKLESQTYDGHNVNYVFTANKGPLVKVRVAGASLSQERIKHLIPIYEEGSVDEDLLNEGGRRIRDYFQSLGYFDTKVDHTLSSPAPGTVEIAYTVQLGARRHVERVSVDGNSYFDAETLQQLLIVHAANSFDRHGVYSQALVTTDMGSLQAVYQNNGFSNVKITPETGPTNIVPGDTRPVGDTSAPLTVVYHISEGDQEHVGEVRMEGNERIATSSLLLLLNTVEGQLYSPRNLAGDRDALVTYYMDRGFDQVRVEVEPKNEDKDGRKVDVTFHITEGKQIFIRNVLLTGLHFTRQSTVAKAITVKRGDPLSESSLDETQRNLYDFALFSEVDTAVMNRSGAETEKTVLIQTEEARRWTFTYGGGFEVQTGTPQNNCTGYIASGVPCTPNGKTGVSPRVLGALTRNNLFGREQSASIQGNYGLLEQKINLVYQYPHFLGNKNINFTFTGGYASSQDVTTYAASKLDGGFRWTQNFIGGPRRISRASTLLYEYDFRRVKVAEESLQVGPSEITLLAAAVRVAGPGFTWLRDTRDSPVDAHRGTYTSFQEFLSAGPFGAEAHFNRIDTSNSSFYMFGKDRYVLARNTRYGQERAFGNDGGELIPLPERLYAGGATSLRGFSINAAGPRDPETGYPVGGAGALVNNVELRLPPPTLPFFGDTLSMVVFHDMGNVFTNAGDIWASMFRVRQPDRDSCKILSYDNPDPTPSGQDTSTGQQGLCSFSYFSHALGLGLRYHTPVGPIRLDFSYNLNPPIYPVNINYSLPIPDSDPHVGQAGHFNFFFSLGQIF